MHPFYLCRCMGVSIYVVTMCKHLRIVCFFLSMCTLVCIYVYYLSACKYVSVYAVSTYAMYVFILPIPISVQDIHLPCDTLAYFARSVALIG